MPTETQVDWQKIVFLYKVIPKMLLVKNMACLSMLCSVSCN